MSVCSQLVLKNHVRSAIAAAITIKTFFFAIRVCIELFRSCNEKKRDYAVVEVAVGRRSECLGGMI